jgi:membrane fusion protein (multidrug efflux system)
VDDAAHVDFTVAQRVATGLRVGDRVDVFVTAESAPIGAGIVALDARIDSTTRNALVRAKIERGRSTPAPGASVRVRVPVSAAAKAFTVPVSALRKGPAGDHVFVVAPDKEGKTRAQVRRVQSGSMLGDEILILDGLNRGERVATSGSFKLREGVLVAVAGDSAASGAGGQGGK